MNKEQAMQEWKGRVVTAAEELEATVARGALGSAEALAKLRAAVASKPDPLRGTGRTTAIAMEMLATAMRSPGWDVQGRDHIGGSASELVNVVGKTARTLGLSYRVRTGGDFAVVRVYPPNTSAEAP